MDPYLSMSWFKFWLLVSLLLIIKGLIDIFDERRKNPEFKSMFLYSLIFMIVSIIMVVPVTLLQNYPLCDGYLGMSGVSLGGIFFNPWINAMMYFFVSFICGLTHIRFLGITSCANAFAVGLVGSYFSNRAWNHFKDKSINLRLFMVVLACNISAMIVTYIQSLLIYPEAINLLRLFLINIPFIIIETAIVIMIVHFLPNRIRDRL